jgi:sugar lactone lactonase YvrE
MRRLAGWTALVAAAAFGQGIVPVTHGPGTDTEGAWSPDGKRIVFQREQDGDADLVVLELATGEERALVAGPGDARYPCWSPDGKTVVYSFGHITTTAHQGIPNGYNLFSVPADGGEPRRLTEGQVRDYTPCFSPDGKSTFFATTRDLDQNNAALAAMDVGTSEIRPLLRFAATNMGAVSPTISPDGRFFACAVEMGLRANWRLAVARCDEPAKRALVTPPESVMYAPRWSPDGTMLACTGYRLGDPGWGICILRLSDGAMARLDTGPGNARSPSWSPDGRSLVFENNGTGNYRLYRMEVGEPSFGPAPETTQVEDATPCLNLSFADTRDGIIPDLTKHDHQATIQGDLPVTDDGAIQCGEGSAQIAGHEDFAFGRGAFYVRAEIFLESHPKRLQLVVVGDYPEHRLGWQIFINAEGRACFNSRTPAGDFVGAMMPRPLPTGRRVLLTGVRDAQGDVTLLMDGSDLAVGHGSGATMTYGTPTQIRVGSQFSGGDRFVGKIYRLEVGRGVPEERRQSMLTLAEVLGQ